MFTVITNSRLYRTNVDGPVMFVITEFDCISKLNFTFPSETLCVLLKCLHGSIFVFMSNQRNSFLNTKESGKSMLKCGHLAKDDVPVIS